MPDRCADTICSATRSVSTPAAVSCTLRVSRSSNCAPSSRSSSATARLSDDCDTCISAAAAVKLAALATAAYAASSRRFASMA